MKALVNIRKANTGDACVLTMLGRQTFHDTFASQNLPEDMTAYIQESFTLERVAAELADPNAFFLLAEIAGELIGYAKLAAVLAPPCITVPQPLRLSKLYVSAEVIGSGIGAALMQACFEWGRKSGYRSLWLGVWEHNTRARSFYKRWGFAPVGTENFRLGSDDQTDVLMQLEFGRAMPE